MSRLNWSKVRSERLERSHGYKYDSGRERIPRAVARMAPSKSKLTHNQEKLVSFIYFNVPNVRIDEVRYLLEYHHNEKIQALKQQAQINYNLKHQGSHRKRAVFGKNIQQKSAVELDQTRALTRDLSDSAYPAIGRPKLSGVNPNVSQAQESPPVSTRSRNGVTGSS